MNKIIVTGDIHGNPFQRLNVENFPEGKTFTKEDYVIILGDFGLVWDDSAMEHSCLDWLENKPWTTLFIDGNHENYDLLNKFPIEEWGGGRVQKIRSSVIHLLRGEVYDIGGYKFLAMGGARSHDIQDGVLEVGDPRIKIWKKDNFKLFRINHISWWEEEIPNEEERKNALKNLAENDYKIDYILTHEAPSSDVVLMDHLLYHPDEYSKWLEMEIRQKVKYKKWFFGHYHLNLDVNEKETCLFERRVRIV